MGTEASDPLTASFHTYIKINVYNNCSLRQTIFIFDYIFLFIFVNYFLFHQSFAVYYMTNLPEADIGRANWQVPCLPFAYLGLSERHPQYATGSHFHVSTLSARSIAKGTECPG